MGKKTVLVVDDNSVNRMMLRGILDDVYDIVEAENGKEVIEILEQQIDSLSAVVLDILMPVMDGYEFLEKVKAAPKLCNIPVIAVTQMDDEVSEIKALSLGAMDFLPKLYRGEIIKAKLKNIIALYEKE